MLQSLWPEQVVRAENLHHFLDAGVLEVHSSAGSVASLTDALS
ncbi:hypothetical protein ACLB1M_15290 [Escherichia coli]